MKDAIRRTLLTFRFAVPAALLALVAGPPCRAEVDAEASAAALKGLKAQLRSGAGLQGVAGAEFATAALTKRDAAEAERLLWQAYAEAERPARAEELKRGAIQLDGAEMPIFYRTYGKAPKSGRSLYISMHGGGGAPARVNDRQWENQKRLYRPAEGVYCAPRAPSNEWDLWHRAPVGRMFDRLIESFILAEGVDPNRVYLMGYSAGGDGVYQLAPRMADRWAAAAMMAGHPNDASPLGLRNIGFALQVGGRDTAYKRNRVAAEWGDKLAELAKLDAGAYRHLVKVYPNKGHWMDREDAIALPWMARFTRDPYPQTVVWRQDDVTRGSFYWLAVDGPNRKPRSTIRATRDGAAFTVNAEGVTGVTLRLHDQMAPLDEEVTVTLNGREAFRGVPRRTIAKLAESIARRGDPAMVFSAEITVGGAG
ncbi:MAG: alpha/beta hydrolase [Planctomycetota bacterium]